MCGIVGMAFFQADVDRLYFSPKNKDAVYKRVFRSMMTAAQYLGHDAAGAFIGKRLISSTPKIHNIGMYKQPGTVGSFLDSKNGAKLVDDFITLNETLYAVGHVRAATSGSACDNRNNHPFICGNIVGVHNGVIYNDVDVAKEAALTLGGTCDSEVIFSLIDRFLTKEGTERDDTSVIEAVTKTSDLITGWYTCVMADKRDFSRLVFFRHSAPLDIMFDETSGVLLFASRKDIILEAVKKHGLPTVRLDEVSLPENEGMIIDLYGDITPATASRFPLRPVDQKKSSAEEAPKAASSYGGLLGDDAEDLDEDGPLAALARAQQSF